MTIIRQTIFILVVVLGLAACGGGNDNGDAAAPAETDVPDIEAVQPQDTTSLPETATATSVAPSTTTEAPAPNVPSEPAVFLADAQVLTQQFSALDAGEYLVDNLGVPFSMEVNEGWRVQPNDLGFVVLTDPDSQGPGDRDIVFVRPSSLSDPSNPAGSRGDQVGWPIDDIGGWLDAITDASDVLIVSNRQEGIVASRQATTFDLEVNGNDVCGPEFCVGFVAIGPENGKPLDPGFIYRVHWFDDDAGPVAMVIGARPAHPDWFATADALIATVAFGDFGPHPIDADIPLWEQGIPTEVPAGRISLPVGTGMSFELDSERFVFQDNGFAVVVLRVPAGVPWFVPISDGDGNPVTSVDEVVAALDAVAGGELERLETDPDITFDHVHLAASGVSKADFALKWDDSSNGYESPVYGEIWVLDTPMGVLVVAGESDDNQESADAAVALATQLLHTLEVAEN